MPIRVHVQTRPGLAWSRSVQIMGDMVSTARTFTSPSICIDNRTALLGLTWLGVDVLARVLDPAPIPGLGLEVCFAILRTFARKSVAWP